MNNKQPLRCIALLCACILFVLWACRENAHGFQVTTTDGGAAVRWPATSAGFYINPAGAPSTGLPAIRAAMQTWTDVATSNFSFAYRGQTASASYGHNDGVNMVCFGVLGAGYESTLSLNTFWFNSQTGRLLDSDIKFNTEFAWATDGSPGAFDVQTIALHELGHALALDDLYGSADTAKAMYAYCNEGEIKRSLTQDDKDGITYIYGANGSTTTTSTIKTTTTTTMPGPGGQCPAAYVLGRNHPYLEQLRAFRDGFLSRSAVGRRIINMYYDHADGIIAALDGSPALRAAARRFFEAAFLLTADKQ